MASTTNYSWSTPDNSGLVKNGAQDIRTLGSAVDTSLWNVGFGQAGKNKIINGDFSIWQRSTSATVTSENYFAPDRFRSVYSAGGATVTWSRQTFTPGTAPVAGYEGQYFSRMSATSGSGTTVIGINPRIENVQTFAGQTATISFWAKADSVRTATILVVQNFGTGGSADSNAYLTSQALTTSWVRYTFTTPITSVAGKTIGANSFLGLYIYLNTGQASGSPQLDIWGVQMEYGSTATPFQTATGTIQGELAACSRYYQFAYGGFMGLVTNTAYYGAGVTFAVPMRTTPTVARVSDYAVLNFNTPYVETPADTGFMAAAQASSSASNYFRTKYSASAEL